MAKRNNGAILVALGIAFLMVMMDNTILNVALQEIQQALNASIGELQWSVDSYILVYAALMFTAGVVADRFGRKKVLIIGLIIFSFASAMAGLSHTPLELIIWRSVMGIGGAVVPPATLAIIRTSIQEEKQASAMGVWAALGGLSVAFGPILGGVILENFYWGNIFLVNIPLAAVCVILLIYFVPESTGSEQRRIDLVGIIVSILSIGLLVAGIIRGGESGDWMSLSSGGLLLSGIVFGVILVVVESRVPDPAFDLKLFSSRAFTGGTLAISSAFFSLTGGTFILVFYVQLVLGKTPLQLGYILLPVAVGSVVGALQSDRLVKSVGYRAAVGVGLSLLALSIFGLTRVQPGQTLIILEIALAIAGLGMGVTMASTTSLVMASVSPKMSAVSSAVNNTLRQIGAALGVAIMGSLLTGFFRNNTSDVFSTLPATQQDSAGASFGAALQMAQESGDQVRGALVASIQSSYVDSMHSTLWVTFALLLVSILVSVMLIPRSIS